MIPLLLLVLLIGLAPFGNALATSLYSDVYGQRTWVGLSNFRYLLTDPALGYSLNITLAWALASTLLILTGGVLFASVLNRKGSGSRIFYGVLLIPWAIPVYIAVPVWRAIIHGNGGTSILSSLFGIEINLLTDPAGAVIATLFTAFWTGVPMTAFLLAGSLKKIPASCIDAARIDGADEGAILSYITVPQIRGSLLILAILSFIKSFKEFSLIYLMTAGGPPLVSGITSRHIVGATGTIGVFLYEIFSETDDFGLIAAFSIIVMALVALCLLLWAYTRRPRRRRRPLALAAAVLQPVFAGWPGLVWSAFFITGYFRTKIFFFAAGAHIVYTIIMVSAKGFLRGFQPAVLLSITALLLIKTGERKRFRKRPALTVLPGISASLFFLFTSLALIFLVLISLSRINALTPSGLIRGGFTLNHYRYIAQGHGIWRSFLNTLVLSGLTAVLISFITFPAAVWLSGPGLKRSPAFLSGIQLLTLTGGMHTLIPLYAMFISLRMINSYVPLVLIYLYQAMPLALFTTFAFLSGLPKSLRDQARLDGVGPLRFMTGILLPLSSPVLVTSSMVAFLGAWNGFMAPLLFLNEESRYTVSLKLFSLLGALGAAEPKWNLFAAASVVNLVIVGLLFFRFRRPLSATALGDVDE